MILNAIQKFLKWLLVTVLFIGDGRVPIQEKLSYLLGFGMTFSAIGFVTDLLFSWYESNADFIVYFIIAVTFNMGFGIWRHLINKTFNWEKFFVKTIVMLIVVITVYVLLTILTTNAPSTTVGDYFQFTIQFMTLMYPASKTIKSLFIISKGEYPPKWIMTKFYNYDETGSLKDFFKDDSKKD